MSRRCFTFRRLLFVGPPLLFLMLLYFYPLAKILILGFHFEGSWSLGGLGQLTRTWYYTQTLWFTTWQAALSTLLTFLAALPAAWAFARFEFKGKRILQALTTVPFMLPTVVAAAAMQAFLGPYGLVNEWLMALFDLTEPPIRLQQTVWFFLLAHVFFNYTVVLRIVGGFWSRLSDDLTDAARMLGASGTAVFFKVTWPILRPAVFAAAILVFLFCFTSFGVVLILGGPRLATIEVEIYRQAVNVFNLPLAAALSLVQIIFTFVLMWVYTRIGRKASVDLTPKPLAAARHRPRLFRHKLLVWSNVVFMLFLLGGPLGALLARSVSSEQGLTLVFFQALFENDADSIFFVPPLSAIGNSLGIALLTMVMALFLGLSASLFLAGPPSRIANLLDPLFMLPLSTSAVTLGFGYIIALDRPPLNLRSSFILVPLAHTLVAFPFVVRCILPTLRSIPNRLREAASVLGASPLQTWLRIDRPLLTPALVMGAIFAFTVSMGEFGATVFIARPQSPTMPLAIYRFLGQPGVMNYGQAMAMSSLLVLVTAVSFLFLEALGSRRGNGG